MKKIENFTLEKNIKYSFLLIVFDKKKLSRFYVASASNE